jgi:hypothetical protein
MRESAPKVGQISVFSVRTTSVSVNMHILVT